MVAVLPDLRDFSISAVQRLANLLLEDSILRGDRHNVVVIVEDTSTRRPRRPRAGQQDVVVRVGGAVRLGGAA